jgi:hypothetical protein
MKAMRILAIAGALAACSSPEDMSTGLDVDTARLGPKPAQDVPQPPAAPAPAPDAEPVAFSDNAKDGEAVRDFAYSWPREVSAIAPLAAMLGERRDDALARQKSEWRESLAEFGAEECFACVNRDYAMEWQVVTDTPRFLSLSASGYIYTGGAHGMPLFDTLVWDREARGGEGDVLDPLALFASADALSQAVSAPFCAALDKERARRREGFD